ncbi:MAG: hypothetical protein V9E90_01390 [Saprospiraceae bacterium]
MRHYKTQDTAELFKGFKNVFLLAAALWLLSGFIFIRCDKTVLNPVASAKAEIAKDLEDRTAFANKLIMHPPSTASAISPCDSVVYMPVAWGSELRILSRTISSGNRKGFGPFWQAKGFAWQEIGPTKYQQDSTRERVVFADSDTITYTDTFYICRKFIK